MSETVPAAPPALSPAREGVGGLVRDNGQEQTKRAEVQECIPHSQSKKL